MTGDQPPRPQEPETERLPRLGLIRVFLSLLVGGMAGLVGWMAVVMAILLKQGPSITARIPPLPPSLHLVAFGLPAIAAGYWIFSALGSGR